MDSPITVIIAVKNGERTIRDCLESILRLEQPAEILVVDDGSTDLTARILGSFAGKIRVIRNQQSRGPSMARNQAAALARGEFLAFTDGDCIVAGNWLAELMKGFERGENVAACGGSQEVPERADPFEKKVFGFMSRAGIVTDYVKSSRIGVMRQVRHNPSCNSMYRRRVFLEAGGFQEKLWPGEDVELDYRLRRKGYQLIFNPAARVYHYRPRTMAAFARMMQRYGRAQGVLVRQYGMFRAIHFLPLAELALATGWLGLLFVGSAAAVACAAVAAVAVLIYLRGVARLGLVAWLFWHCGFISGLLAQKSLDKKP